VDHLKSGISDIKAEGVVLEQRVEEAVRRAVDRLESDAGLLGSRISAKFSYLPFGPLSAALVWPTLAATGALMLYEWQGFEVNQARFARRSALLKPAELSPTAEEPFERIYRQHQQTGEALITLIPSLYTFSFLVSPRWAFALGGGWLASRILYLYASKSIEKPVYAVSYITQMALLMGSAVNATRWSFGLFLTWMGTIAEDTSTTTTSTVTVPVIAAPIPTEIRTSRVY
jgi:hypothetical protein